MRFAIEPTAEERMTQTEGERTTGKLLKIPDGTILPDPLLLTEGWLRETESITSWLPIFLSDITLFIMADHPGKDVDLHERVLNQYKEGKAFRLFASGWLKEVYMHHISTDLQYCLLKANCTHSMKIADTPHKVWIAVCKTTGRIWMAQMESMLSDLLTSWDGLLLITGDLNIDMLKPNASLTKQYAGLLSTFNLTQHVQKPTRITPHSETLIDHIVSSDSKRVTHVDVLPCSNVSDHDAPYACLNIRVDRFVPRFKMIRNERGFKEEEFVRDFTSLPLSVIQATDDPEEKLRCLLHSSPNVLSDMLH
ncbi:hypothetical protein ACROYT_G016745 [Oculina patagonica]